MARKKSRGRRKMTNAKLRALRSGSAQTGSSVTTGRVPPRNFLSTYLGGVPQTTRRTLTWIYRANINLAVNTYGEYVFVLNSPYDPDNAVGGTSAVGFSKMMAFYTKCFTLGSRIKWIGAQQNASFGVPNTFLDFGITLSTFNTSLGSVTSAIQSGLCTYGLISINPDHFSKTMSVDVGKFLNKPMVLDDPELFCTGSGNPSQIICAHCWYFPTGNANTQCIFVFEIEFDVVFTDPQPFS